MGSAVNLDGRIVPPEEARVSVFDRGFLYGDSVYETLRTYAGRVFMVERHLARLRRSAAGIHLDLPGSDAELEDALARTAAAARGAEAHELYLRLIVTRGAGEVGLDPALADRPLRVVIALPYTPLPAGAYERGVRVVVSTVRRNAADALAPWLKTGNYLNNMLALREARSTGAMEAVMLNGRGDLAEATTSNLFLVEGGRLLTPSLESGILPGVTRALVLEEARAHGLDVEEAALAGPRLAGADEAFLTSTLKEVVPVVTVDDRAVGAGVPGPVTRHVMDLFRGRVGRWLSGA